jgi:hypothetical protein
MRAMLEDMENNVGTAFDLLRKSYRLRNDFGSWVLSGATGAQARKLQALGFTSVR